MADCSRLLQQGLGLVQTAAQHDAAGNYQEAVRLYSLALDAFLSVLKMERNPRIVETLKGKVVDYMNRAEELKALIVKQQSSSTRGGGGGGLTTDPTSLVLPSPPADLPARGQNLPSVSPPLVSSSSTGAFPTSPAMPPASPVLGAHSTVSVAPPSPYMSGGPTPSPSGSFSLPTPHEGGLINIEEGQLGRNFESIFAAYIIDSQEIWIKDPNLVHTHQVYNLIRFCELVVRINRKVARPCVRIHVLTAYENDMQLETLQSAFNELAESLRVHSVELLASFDNRGEREVVFSSGWTLVLPHGLDIHQSPASRFRLGACDLMLRPTKQNVIKVIKHHSP
jgi:hypothetical protein